MSTPTMSILPARTSTVLHLPKTRTLKITNTHGSQVVDLWALNPSSSPPSSEYLSMAHNHAIHRRINFLKGSYTPNPTPTTSTTGSIKDSRATTDSIKDGTRDVVLYSSTSRPMLLLREDTSPGDHDTLIAACNPLRYERLGVQGPHASCADNYQKALTEYFSSSSSNTSTNENPFPPTTPPPPLNLFMNVKVVDDDNGGTGTGTGTERGDIVFRAPTSKAGDFVVLEALMDVVVVLSACPMDRRASEDWVPSPKEVGYEVC